MSLEDKHILSVVAYGIIIYMEAIATEFEGSVIKRTNI